MISDKEQLERAVLQHGILPFFRNKIKGLSVEEMASPGMLFGLTDEDYGCWEWKGPVILQQTSAYGKFFNKKAGFISLNLLPDFLNYRRNRYPVLKGSLEERILEIVRNHEGITSTDLKNVLFGKPKRRRTPEDLIDIITSEEPKRRPGIESPLQRLQMGGHLLIANFEYKYTSSGKRYGWGVALYSTPEIWFGKDFDILSRTPAQSLEFLIEEIKKNHPSADKNLIRALIS